MEIITARFSNKLEGEGFNFKPPSSITIQVIVQSTTNKVKMLSCYS